jgi:hypothetical protein
MKRFLKSLLLAVSAGVFVGGANAVPITTLFNTGVNGSGVALPGGSIDPHWDVVAPPGDADVVNSVLRPPNGIPTSWLPNTAASAWIWENADGLPIDVTRTFETKFDMTGLDLSTAVIVGRWATDNNGLNIFINGVDIVPPNPPSPLSGIEGFTTWTDFTVGNANLVQGINTLRFEVKDVGSIAGFRAEFTTATADRVPDGGSTVILLGSALSGLAYFRRKLA